MGEKQERIDCMLERMVCGQVCSYGKGWALSVVFADERDFVRCSGFVAARRWRKRDA